LVEALEKGEVVEIPGASTIADGLAVKAVRNRLIDWSIVALRL